MAEEYIKNLVSLCLYVNLELVLNLDIDDDSLSSNS
jgi:hypothetical protein